MAANVTDSLWELPELLDALLSVPETGAPRGKRSRRANPKARRASFRTVAASCAPLPAPAGRAGLRR